MNRKPKAFLLHGFIGAGKTTFAKRLEEEEKALRFTHDEWMNELYGNDPPADLFPEYARRVFRVMEMTWTRGLSVGTNVILDFGFWSWAERQRTRALVAEHGGDAILYRLHCADEVAWDRVSERNRMLAGGLFIAPGTFQTLKARFEPLRDDEARIEVE
ncbi:AAA family ATPase [Pleomorphomonas sp. JP5]|uniref:AAA family ATPase n=1 Tax=Pleomorphomonas sp. JP5 TaxID=2942998 RepID=UPI0020447AE7|nr:AAA family ATPase [Pleomorphomonas sp. JP5]MCM5556419.1 AAA family ATPase [Pleomorphomonas sp. JP5]